MMGGGNLYSKVDIKLTLNKDFGSTQKGTLNKDFDNFFIPWDFLNSAKIIP